jgi:hypothetical protein
MPALDARRNRPANQGHLCQVQQGLQHLDTVAPFPLQIHHERIAELTNASLDCSC